MAFQIGDFVVYGVIDNRDINITHAKIWFRGYPQSADISLKGNCLKDIAGRRITFYNPCARKGAFPIITVQDGVCGDITTTRKVKQFHESRQEAGNGEEETQGIFDWVNGLYFEWFSQQNARVIAVIPRAMIRSSRQSWKMTAKQENEQKKANRQILKQFQECVAKVAAEQIKKENLEEHQLKKVDRALNQIMRIEKLREKVGEPEILEHYPGEQPTSLDEEEDFLTGLVAVDNDPTPECSHWEHLAEAGIYPRKALDIPDDEIEYELWNLIYALGMLGVFIDSTDHLSDRELYEIIVSKLILEKAMFPPGIGWNTHFPIYELASDDYDEGENIYMRYYLDEGERERWKSEFPDTDIPPHEELPYSRDHLLPTGYEDSYVKASGDYDSEDEIL